MLVHVLLTVAALLALSLSLVIQSCQPDCDLSHRTLDTISFGLRMKKNGQEDDSPTLGNLCKDHTDPNTSRGDGNSRCNAKKEHKNRWQTKWRIERRSSNPPPEYQTPREQRAESPNPTMEEMRLVLTDEEVESYIEHWRVGKEYQSRLRTIERGDPVTAEELRAGRLSFNEARRLQEYVKAELVRSNRARPKMVESYENRLRITRVDGDYRRTRRRELKSLVENELANPDEVEEYERLLADFRGRYQRARKAKAEKQLAHEQRMEELRERVEAHTATDAERVEYENMTAERQREVERKVQAKAMQKSRMEELEKLVKAEAATDAERAEYEKKMTKHQAELEREAQIRANKRSRIEELKKLINESGGTDAEHAEYAKLMSEREKWRKRTAQARADEKTRQKELERLIKEEVATDAERAEYEDMLAKRRQKAQRQYHKTKNRMAELEKLVKAETATDAERAEYEEMMAKHQEQTKRKTQAILNKKAADRKRFKELEKLVQDGIAITEAERAEYEDLLAKRQRQKSYEDKSRKKKAESKHTSGSSNAGDQPLQSSNNPLVQKPNLLLNGFDKVWRKVSSQAQHSPWNVLPAPGGARPGPIRFGVVP